MRGRARTARRRRAPVGYLFQAMRWRRVANVSQPGLRRFYEMVICGLACNNVLPVRIELLRAGWLSREAPMPGGRALGRSRSIACVTL